ncbi:ubiquinone/menaquinone biosynthesis C-methylase UbiE [Nocardia mexicana]|uniref:Ubiquinone/menaquinone biosynthesis C-methylase UbiE n=2 Tax=Nocardia mexicana TaxID=279262 RepID=A0A370GJS5_9NOCA|nr:ubiquinone/menaquinone biosynthesis C-methylase UbiE [Nocardia mexicana]
MRRWTREWLRLAALPLVPDRAERIGRLYDLVGTGNLFGEDSLYINLGYWRHHPATLDEASVELARLLGREAFLRADDVVLDVGCGYGEQDLLWAREFGCAEIIGVNVAPEQVRAANARVAASGLGDRIRYVQASAMELPRDDASVTKVLALESPFHFPSQRRFFAESLRVLEPGGRLVTADIVPRRGVLNQLDREGYRDALRETGFQDVRVYSIRRDVYRPLSVYLRTRLRDPDMREVNPLLRMMFSTGGVRAWSVWLDYVIAVATKGDGGQETRVARGVSDSRSRRS